MKKWKIVITGGPCGGKTTGISILKQDLVKKGFKVIVIPETATELILSGICPWEIGEEKFQSILIERALNKEKTACDAAECIDKETIIIYDRALFDARAYMSNEAFRNKLKQYNIDENIAINQYDVVIHLVTAADGAEEFYTLLNNEARKETIIEACELDKKTRESWKGNKNLKVIDNSTDFDNKMKRLLQEVYQTIGLSTGGNL